MKVLKARFKKIEKAMAPREPWDITVEIAPLPSLEDRRHIEANNPDVSYIWIEPAKIAPGSEAAQYRAICISGASPPCAAPENGGRR